jgi:ATP-dependent helicase Lhr and Lhr-like helicase
LRWWTWAGYRANGGDLRPSAWREVPGKLAGQLCLPEVDEKALAGLKFSEALPRPLAVATLATRLADLEHARSILMEPCRFEQLARYRSFSTAAAAASPDDTAPSM